MMKKVFYLVLFAFLVLFYAGCNLPMSADTQDVDTPAANNAPYDVIGPSDINYTYDYNTEHYFTLTTNAPEVLLDPDGDDTEFKSDTLPAGVFLNSETGEITILMTSSYSVPYEEIVTIWLEDFHGKESVYFDLTIHFNMPS
jgi:hypothetical protein